MTKGTTSACAENTLSTPCLFTHLVNYLRVRGEYNYGPDRLFLNKELPPRARRIRTTFLHHFEEYGTTSACAENTYPQWDVWPPPWNYLRVRGEYGFCRTLVECGAELPPRARRIRSTCHMICVSVGTTSACAENTRENHGRGATPGNYLRVRGEYTPTNPGAGKSLELPPRARRIPTGFLTIHDINGTTSACAENTAFSTL